MEFIRFIGLFLDHGRLDSARLRGEYSAHRPERLGLFTAAGGTILALFLFSGGNHAERDSFEWHYLVAALIFAVSHWFAFPWPHYRLRSWPTLRNNNHHVATNPRAEQMWTMSPNGLIWRPPAGDFGGRIDTGIEHLNGIAECLGMDWCLPCGRSTLASP